MRCKKHLPDLTSTVGVCASCLRERLQLILEVQAQAHAQAQDLAQPSRLSFSENNLPSLQVDFPQSVSPYVTHRKSDARRQEILFQTTPEIDQGFKSSAVNDGGAGSVKRRIRRLWILSNLFRTRTNSDPRESCEVSPSVSATPPSTTTLPARRRNNNRVSDHRRCRQLDRGASPVDNFETLDRSQFVTSSESSPRSRNKTTAATSITARRSRLGYAGKSLASMALCLSPLVRASPKRNWNKGLGQELSVGGVHHISSAASFCASRSRKLVDLGRAVNKR